MEIVEGMDINADMHNIFRGDVLPPLHAQNINIYRPTDLQQPHPSYHTIPHSKDRHPDAEFMDAPASARQGTPR